LEPTLEGAMALARGATGPLSPHLEAFVTSLIDQRYSVICVRAKSWRAAAFDTWLAEQGGDLADLGDAHIDEFHRRDYRPRSDCRAQPRKHESFALGQLLQYLRGQGLCAAVDSIKVPADALVASFEQFLRRDRGLAAGSIRGYRTSARDFLIHRFGSQSVDLSAVSATDIVGFVRQQARSLRPRGLKNVITALRAFLRFARYRGEIDWDASRLRVRGKNSHECLMPLPADVGEAIAAYLRHGRPASADRHLFLRSRAPIQGLMHGSDAVGSIVRNALQRAGVDAPHKGAHQFRHALAVRMLQGGASLPEIGELLRHRSPLSTSIYAKVDVAALRALALPWPGSAS